MSAAVEALGAELFAARAALLAVVPAARLFAFWDLDGTLLHGDCSEGLPGVYPGLVQLGVEHGLAPGYGADEFVECWQDYRRLDERAGPWLAYPFLAQIFAGAEEAALTALAKRHFSTTLARHFFPGAQTLFAVLAVAGVEQHILSASPEFFARGAADSLGLPPERVHGIRVRATAGRLSGELVPPVTFAEGKRARLDEIMRAAADAEPDRPAYALAAFGNSLTTDGAFLSHVAAQSLPAGRTFAVMVNDANAVAGEVAALFWHLELVPAAAAAPVEQ